MVERLLKLPGKNSFFLFGARGVGKSYLLRESFRQKKCHWIDLLDENLWDRYSLSPEALNQELLAMTGEKQPEWVVIDEIQKAPRLLNVAHRIIGSRRGIKFAMTGSSARRLKQKGVNLLAGRAFVENLFPYSVLEIPKFDLSTALRWGSMPKVFELETPEEKSDYLRSYSLTYIKTEIQEEQWVRKLDPFRRFLPVAAQMNGMPLNFSAIARDVGVDYTTVQAYYSILEETLLGFFLPAFHRSVRRQQRQAPKFFFFDLGVKRSLENKLTQQIYPGSSEYGKAFEHFIICEFHKLNEYYKKDFEFSYLLTKDNLELDLILTRPGDKTALIKIKSKPSALEEDCASLKNIAADLPNSEQFLISNDPVPKKFGKVHALPWKAALKQILKI